MENQRKESVEQFLSKYYEVPTIRNYQGALIKFIKFTLNEEIVYRESYTPEEESRYNRLINTYLRSNSDKLADLHRFGEYLCNNSQYTSGANIRPVAYLIRNNGTYISSSELESIVDSASKPGVVPIQSGQQTLETVDSVVSVKNFLYNKKDKRIRSGYFVSLSKFIDFVNGTKTGPGKRYTLSQKEAYYSDIDKYMNSDSNKPEDLFRFGTSLLNDMTSTERMTFGSVVNFFEYSNIKMNSLKLKKIKSTILSHSKKTTQSVVPKGKEISSNKVKSNSNNAQGLVQLIVDTEDKIRLYEEKLKGLKEELSITLNL